MLIGPAATLLITTDSSISYLAYPLRGVHGLTGPGKGQAAADPPALEALLGTPRAETLRSLDRAKPAGQIAQDLQLSPSTVTHHVTALERAGLIIREPTGRHVLIHRTPRGTALLDLYEP
jgi:biotin operon repressor